MSMLAEKKQRNKWCLNPRGKLWVNDKNTFGQKMLEKMGWSPGEGLGTRKQGIKENLKAKVKSDTTGLGFKNNSEEWLKQQSEFCDLLATLSGDNTEVEDNDVSISASNVSKTSLELKSKQSRARVHCHEFGDAKDQSTSKDLSERSSKDLVLGADSINSGALLSENLEVIVTLNNCDIENTRSKDSESSGNVYCSEDDRTRYCGKKNKNKISTQSVMEADGVFQASINSVGSNHDSKKKRKNKQNLSVNDSEEGNLANNNKAALVSEGTCPVESNSNSEPPPDKKKKKKRKTQTDDNEISLDKNQVDRECVIDGNLVSSCSKKKKQHTDKHSVEEYEKKKNKEKSHESVLVNNNEGNFVNGNDTPFKSEKNGTQTKGTLLSVEQKSKNCDAETKWGDKNRKLERPSVVKRKLRGIVITSGRYQNYQIGKSSQSTCSIEELYNKFVTRNFHKPTGCEDSDMIEENTSGAGTVTTSGSRKFGPEGGRRDIIGRWPNNRSSGNRSRIGNKRIMRLSKNSILIRKPIRYTLRSLQMGLHTISGMNKYLKSQGRNTILSTVLNFKGANLGKVEGYPTTKKQNGGTPESGILTNKNDTKLKAEESCTDKS